MNKPHIATHISTRYQCKRVLVGSSMLCSVAVYKITLYHHWAHSQLPNSPFRWKRISNQRYGNKWDSISSLTSLIVTSIGCWLISWIRTRPVLRISWLVEPHMLCTYRRRISFRTYCWLIMSCLCELLKGVHL